MAFSPSSHLIHRARQSRALDGLRRAGGQIQLIPAGTAMGPNDKKYYNKRYHSRKYCWRAFTICFVYWFGHLLNMAMPFLILIQMRKCRLCLVTDCEATARTCFGKGCAAAVVLWADLDRLEYFNNKLSSSSSVSRCLRLFDYFHFFKTNSFIFSKRRKMPVYLSFTVKDWI